MKKMIMIHPNNFLQGAMGENNRVMQLVYVFKEMGFEIDLFSYENFTPNSTFKNFKKLNDKQMIHKLYLYDFKKGYGKYGLLKRKMDFVVKEAKNKLGKWSCQEYLQDWVPLDAKQMFQNIVKKKDYDIIVCFYTYMATLFQHLNIRAKKFYFMEDSMFLQQYFWDKDRIDGITLGKLMDEELARIKYFDEIFCISNDERIFYEKLTGKQMYFFPHIIRNEIVPINTPLSERKWDVFFIGFNNPFNTAGLNWFMEEVYPLLKKSMKILLVGSVTHNLKIKYKNVDVFPFVPELDEIYANVKVVICPMFQGTGMKVKVVEAMARGLPVVCNERGVDGLPDKNMCGCLITQKADVFAGYINKLIEDEKFYSEISYKIREYYQMIFDRQKYTKLLQCLLNLT